MAYGFAFVVFAFGASLFYKGYKGYSWPEFYATVLGGQAAPAAAASSTPNTTTATNKTGGTTTVTGP